MMNRFSKAFCLMLVLSCIQAVPAFSQQMTREMALEKAKRFLNSEQVGSMTKKKAPRKAVQLTLANDGRDYYVFNDEQNGGYVVVGGDERQQNVLGYSPDGHFDAKNVPANMQWLLDGYAAQTEYLRSHPNYVPSAPKRTKAVAVAPMLDCEWGQGAPYNNMCPTMGDQHCITGCVATAAAQLMYYHKWPKTGKGTVSYEWNGQTLSADLSKSTYQWDQMLPSYDENSSQASQDAVALLMKDVGYAYKMIYDLYSSGAAANPKVFVDYFDYDPSALYLERSNCTQEAWDSIIADELVNKRPVFLSGGNNQSGGHTMVIDGLDDKGYLHINFGWYGSDNGFWDVTSIYIKNSLSITYGLKKNEGGKPRYYFVSTKDFWQPENDPFMYCKESIESWGLGRYDGSFYTALAVENTTTHEITYCFEEYRSIRHFRIDKDLPDGDYIAYPVARLNPEDEWQKLLFSEHMQSFVDVHVANGLYSYANNHIYNGLQDDAYEIDGAYYFLDFQTHEATVTFKNDKFEGCYSGDVTIPGHVNYEGSDFTVTTLGDDAFKKCRIGTLTIPNTVKTIYPAFYDARIDKVVFEEGSQLKQFVGISFNAMEVMNMELNLPEGLEELPSYIFQSSSMTWVSLPSTLTTVTGTPFNATWNLRTLVVNNKTPIQLNQNFLTNIDWSLITLYVPKGCRESYAKAEFWKDLGMIKEFEDTVTVDDVKYILHDDNMTATVLNAYYVAAPNFKLPSSISVKGKEYQVTEIGPFAFATNSRIEYLTVPSSVQFFGEACLYDYSFNTLPKRLYLGHQDPPEVADVRYAGKKGFKPFFWFESLLDWVYDYMELHVPVGSKAKYEADSTWGRLKHIVEDETLGVNAITSNPGSQGSAAIYTLSGVKLDATDINSLPHGIYIKDKKVIVK